MGGGTAVRRSVRSAEMKLVEQHVIPTDMEASPFLKQPWHERSKKPRGIDSRRTYELWASLNDHRTFLMLTVHFSILNELARCKRIPLHCRPT